jgi:hypothetical protein
MTTDNIAKIKKEKKLMSNASKFNSKLEDLAKYLGFLLGFVGKEGGWVYKQTGKVVCQGWVTLGFMWMKKGWIKKTSYGRFFINWHKVELGL